MKYILFRLLFLIPIENNEINPLKSVTLKPKGTPTPCLVLHYLHGLTTELATETDLLTISNIGQCKSRDLV